MARPGAITNNWKRSQKSQEKICATPQLECVVFRWWWHLRVAHTNCNSIFLWDQRIVRLTEFVCEVQQVEDFDLNCFLGTVFILTSQSRVHHSSNVRLLLLPEKWGYFCVKTKGNVGFTQQQSEKLHSFLFFDDWMIFAFLSVCFVDEKLFWSRNILTNGSIFLFSVDKIQKKQTFSSLFFDFTCRVVFPLHSFFVLKNNSSFVLFFVLVVPKKRKKNALKERLKLLFVQVFFFSNRKQIKKNKVSLNGSTSMR